MLGHMNISACCMNSKSFWAHCCRLPRIKSSSITGSHHRYCNGAGSLEGRVIGEFLAIQVFCGGSCNQKIDSPNTSGFFSFEDDLLGVSRRCVLGITTTVQIPPARAAADTFDGPLYSKPVGERTWISTNQAWPTIRWHPHVLRFGDSFGVLLDPVGAHQQVGNLIYTSF